MRPSERPAIPRAVWTLGFVSLFTDMGSEIVHSLLPVLLATTLGASMLTIGLLEGAAEATVLFTKVFSGWASDALGKRKPLVLLGYGLAAAVKPLFPLAGSVGAVATARLLDRFGKGIRGAPRDALVADVTPPEVRGAAFGLRQSMDTIGAVIGPLLAVVLMTAFAGDIRRVLWVAVLPGLVAVLLLATAVREPADTPARTARLPITREGLSRLGAPFWRLALLGGLVALARFSEAFLVLRASERGLPTDWVPMVLVVMSVVYAASAYPAGWLSDRIPRARLLAAGMFTLVLGDGLLAMDGGVALAFAGIAAWGLHMGLTQGILASLVVDRVPAAYRATAFGMFNLVSGAALLVASAGAGTLWQVAGPPAAFLAGAAMAAVAGVAALLAREHSSAIDPRHVASP
jgi:MFS family permease